VTMVSTASLTLTLSPALLHSPSAASSCSSPAGALSATTYTQASIVSKIKHPPHNKSHQDEAYPVIFFQVLHTVWQPMIGPPPLHKFLSYLSNVRWDFMQQRSITGSSQSLQLWQVLATNPRKNFQDTSHRVTDDILIGLSEGAE
jgi:hypothetical protein